MNVAGGYTLGPSIDGKDRSVLYFSSKRPEASAGKLDVYRVHYVLGRGAAGRSAHQATRTPATGSQRRAMRWL